MKYIFETIEIGDWTDLTKALNRWENSKKDGDLLEIFQIIPKTLLGHNDGFIIVLRAATLFFE